MDKGKTLAIVGESGCGKSVTSLAILQLLPQTGETFDGSVLFLGKNLLKMPKKKMNEIRGKKISIVFQ